METEEIPNRELNEFIENLKEMSVTKRFLWESDTFIIHMGDEDETVIIDINNSCRDRVVLIYKRHISSSMSLRYYVSLEDDGINKMSQFLSMRSDIYVD